MKFYDHMIPADSHKNIKRVDIHYSERYNGVITGFSFFDQDHSLFWKIGEEGNELTNVMLSDNDVITGVVAKLSKVSMFHPS